MTARAMNAEGSMDRERARVPWRSGVLLGIICALAFVLREIPARVAAIYPDALPRNPYFVLEHAGLLYGLWPLAVLAGVAVWWAPGLALVWTLGKPRRVTEAMILGFAASFALQIAASALAKTLGGLPLTGAGFRIAVGALSVLSAVLLGCVRRRSNARVFEPASARFWVGSLGLPLVALWVLLPVVCWQNLNDDGFEALHIGESLAENWFPRWPTSSGQVGLGVGMFASAWLNHWFVSWFGPLECAPRLPFFLCLPLLWAALWELIHWSSPRRLGAGGTLGLALGVGTFCVLMTYDAGYNPYFADLSSPGAFDALLISCFLGALSCLLNGRWWAFLGLSVVAHLCRPTGLLLWVLFAAAAACAACGHRRRWVLASGAAIALCLTITWFHEKVYVPALTEGEGLPYRAGSVLVRYRYVTYTDWWRVIFLFVPSGILPVLTFGLWRRHDALGRALIFVSLFYFATFYLPAFVGLHHYVPVMILPLIPCWRMVLSTPSRAQRRGLTLAACLGGSVALVLALPNHFDVDRTYRDLGRRVHVLPAVRAPNAWKDPRAPAAGLEALVEEEGPGDDPGEELVGSPWCVYRYALWLGTAENADFWIAPPNAGPDGWDVLHRHPMRSLFVRPNALRPPLRPPRDRYAAPLFEIPRDVLHRHRGIVTRRYDLSLRGYLPDE